MFNANIYSKIFNKTQSSTTKANWFAPHPCPNMMYGNKTQCTLTENSLKLTAKQVTPIQRIIGSTLYLGSMIDTASLAASNNIAARIKHASERTKNLADWITYILIPI